MGDLIESAMQDKIISHYKILEKIGEGGMGIIYKAQDIKLDRILALKFLQKHLFCNNSVKARFTHKVTLFIHNNIEVAMKQNSVYSTLDRDNEKSSLY